MTPPPRSAGAFQETVTWLFPGVATTDVGAPGIARIAIEILAEVAAVNPPASVMVAEMVQVPVELNATTPEVEPTEQTEVVALVYEIVPDPVPAEAVVVRVGPVADRA